MMMQQQRLGAGSRRGAGSASTAAPLTAAVATRVVQPVLLPARAAQASTAASAQSSASCSSSNRAAAGAQWLLGRSAACTSRRQGQRVAIVARDAATPSSSSPSLLPEEEADFDLLSTKVTALTKEVTEELRGCSIFLVGMMGSGKSTVGKMLANTLKYAFFDTDSVIELAHDKKPVSEIFKEFGQDYFRQCESQILRELSPYKKLVVATGGGAVIKPENWGCMQIGIVCWLNGDVDLLARRVAKDGVEKRPLLYADGVTEANLMDKTREKLSGLLNDRRKFYESADVVVSLEGHGADVENGAPTAVVMYRLLRALNEKMQEKKRESEERKNFKIEGLGDVKTMRSINSPAVPEAPQE